MKKGIALCVFVFMTLLLTGCGGSKTLTILVDIQTEMGISERDVLVATNEIEQALKNRGGPENVEFTTLPPGGEEREIVVEELRTEIMAGGGPDVFIVNLNQAGEKLFPIVEKSMEQDLFLTLDPYMEDARFMNPEALTAVVMEAGRNAQGQQLLPMTYTFPVTYYDDAAVTDTPSAALTWEDMLDDETGILRNAAASIYAADDLFVSSPFGGLLGAFGTLADYENGTLHFTEEVLRQHLAEADALYQQVNAGEFAELPLHHKGSMSVAYDGSWGKLITGSLPQAAEVEMVPQYNDAGGVTAIVMSFIGINRNTERPKDAFFVADYLMSGDAQQNLKLYEKLFLNASVPTQKDLMQAAYPVDGWFMSENNYAEFCAARDVITQVRFFSEFDRSLGKLFFEWHAANIEGQDVDALIAEAYGTMQLQLQE